MNFDKRASKTGKKNKPCCGGSSVKKQQDSAAIKKAQENSVSAADYLKAKQTQNANRK